MSSAQRLREFIQQRLTAAAEEIFTEFGKTIVRYEEEIDRQRRLLDISCKPETELHATVPDFPRQHIHNEEVLTHQQPCNQERSSSLDQEEQEPAQIKEEQEELCSSQLGLKEETDTFMVTAVHEESDHKLHLCRPLHVSRKPMIKLHRIDLPQQHVCEEDDVLTTQETCNQDRNSSLDQEEPEPPQIKEEQEELCGSQEGEQLGLKEETETFMVTAPYEDSDHSEPETNHSDSTGSRNTTHCNSAENSLMSESQCDFGMGKKSAKCDVSGKAVQDQPQMNRHTCEKPFSCNICGKMFTRSSHLLNHVRTHTGERPFSCKTCGKMFKQRCQLLVHVRTHTGEKPYSCKMCGKMFTRNSYLLEHKRIHTGERPYSCKTCGKMFKQRCHLLVHQKTHSDEKPCHCDICGKTFIFSSRLLEHIRTHTGERPYSCNTCGKMFKQRCHLLVHQRTHTGEKPYHCETCGKMFTFSSHLLVHTRTHTGEKPYHCETCGKTFTCRTNLMMHIRTHTGERPYHCETCGKMFSRNYDLLRHMKTHTGQKSKS